MLDELQRWYLAQCNGDWEHQYGISVETLDNPGWRVRIDLGDTALESRSFTPIKDTEPESAWVHYTVKDRVFEAHCGPLMSRTAIRHFLAWATA